MRNPNLRLVQFKDGSRGLHVVYVYEGVCITGDPTAYIKRGDVSVWVKPGAAVDFIEA